MKKKTTKKAAPMFRRKSATMRLLEEMNGGPLTFGGALWAVRKCEEMTQADCAKLFGISKSHLCDVEKGRKSVSPERAAQWARLLGHSEASFIRLSIQGALDAAGLHYQVAIRAA